MVAGISVTMYSDPACPWAYSASPALRVLEWRYGDQLDWRLVLIGLTERADQYADRGYTPLGSAIGHTSHRRFGMPLSPRPRPRLYATSRACRAVVAARLLEPGSEWHVFRTLQFAWLTSGLMLDEDDQLSEALSGARGIDAGAILALLDEPAVTEAYEKDRAEARTAAGSAAELQGKTAQTDGPVRFTAPSLVFQRGGQRLIAGGFQSLQAYDVLVANLDPTLQRQPPPETPEPLLAYFSDGLTTQEVAQLLTQGNDDPNRSKAERALLELVWEGKAARTPLGDDALWRRAYPSAGSPSRDTQPGPAPGGLPT